jgi:hypothetical protein
MILNAITLFDEVRLSNLTKQCSDQKIELHLWNGITEFDVKTNISKSHKQIILNAKSNQLDMVCVCEDDIQFVSPKSYKYFIDNIPVDDFSMYFGGVSGGFIDEQNIVHNFSGMFLYCVHKSFYDIFLSADETKNLDRWLGNFYFKSAEIKPVFKVCNPLVAKTINGYSDHFKQEVCYDTYWKPYKYL